MPRYYGLYAVQHPVWGYGYLSLYAVKQGVTYFRFVSNQYGAAVFSTEDMVNHNIPRFSVREGKVKR